MVKNFTTTSAVSSSDSRVDGILDTLDFGNDITLKTNILPDTTNTHNIGSTSLRCNNICGKDADYSGFITLADGTGNTTSGIGYNENIQLRFLVAASGFVIRVAGLDRFTFTSGYLQPNISLDPNLGNPSNRWANVFCNVVDQLSDARVKQNVKPLKMGIGFINKLNPVSFQMTVGTDTESKRMGFIAQEVEKVLAGYTDMNNTTLLRLNNKGEENEEYSLSYTELIAPLVSAVQDLSKEVKKLKKEIDALKSMPTE